MTSPPSTRLLPIVLITILAISLRVSGIGWGLPNAQHALSYHPDETVMLMHSTSQLDPSGLNIFAGRFLPHFYHYGSLQLVLSNIAISIATAYDHPAFTSGPYDRQLFADYLTGRLLTALMGTGTVWVLWALGRRMYGETAGVGGALALAITPLHVQHSHFMTVDVPATLWVTLSLLWSARSRTDSRRLAALALAGCFAGLAGATKYNCALVLLPAVCAALYTGDDETEGGRWAKPQRLGALFCSALISYLIACPGTILENGLFVRDFLFEARHVSSQQELWFQGTGIGWWYVIVRNLSDGMGWPLLVASLAGAVFAARKREFGDLLTLSFALPYYLLVGAAQSRYARYEIPLLPILALWAARYLIYLGQQPSTAKLTNFVVSPVVVAFTAASALLLLIPMLTPDPRDRAAEWISANTPSTSLIGVPVEPWFWTPPLCPYFSMPGVGQWENTTSGQEEAERIVFNPAAPFDTDQLRQAEPPIVVMSEFEYFDRLRLRDPEALEYLRELRKSYSKPIVFADNHWLGGRRTIGGLPCQDLPHDMLYTSATVLVFKRL